jgi:hypothetical protein
MWLERDAAVTFLFDVWIGTDWHEGGVMIGVAMEVACDAGNFK